MGVERIFSPLAHTQKSGVETPAVKKTDLDTALGPEAWDILNNHATMSNLDIFKAILTDAGLVISLFCAVVKVLTCDLVIIAVEYLM